MKIHRAKNLERTICGLLWYGIAVKVGGDGVTCKTCLRRTKRNR